MKFKYCPYCKSELKESEHFFICLSCSNKVYKNSIPAASTVPIKENKVLLVVRSKDPQKGKIDVIGGFANPGEHPKDAAIRETKEESNLDIEILDFTGIYMDKYLYKGVNYDVMNVYYVVKIAGNEKEMKPADDVANLKWFDIDNLPKDEFAFDHLKPGLSDVRRWIRDHLERRRPSR